MNNEKQQLDEEIVPYIDENGILVLPKSWRDDDDDLSYDDYRRLILHEEL